MKQQIENIIKENLPEKKEHREFECNGAHNGKGCYEDWCDVETCISKDAMTCKGFNQALSQINTSLIADEVLKVVVEKINSLGKGLPILEGDVWMGGFLGAKNDILELLK